MRFLTLLIIIFCPNIAFARSGEPELPRAVRETAQKILDDFTKIRSMTGEFIQFSPGGEEIKGVFFVQRPGKLRFNYTKPAHHEIIADGKSLVILNKKLKTSDLYPVSKTPLKFLLDNKIDLSNNYLQSLHQKDNQTIIELSDKKSLENRELFLFFDTQSSELKRWTIKENKAEEITVLIFNTRHNVAIEPSLFKIDYTMNRVFNQKQSHR